MALRPTQSTTFALVQAGLYKNQDILSRVQQQISSGKRILRPSDDPVGTSRALSLRRQVANVGTYIDAIASVTPKLSTATTHLEEASSILSQARALTIQGMNGTNSQSDRNTIANQIELLRDGLFEIGNARLGGQYLFAGADTLRQPFEESVANGNKRVQYVGDGGQQRVQVGLGVEVRINIPGSSLFGGRHPSGVSTSGLTGIQVGTSANSGSGYLDLTARHDATIGALGSGLAFVNGGAEDTILGDKALVVDAAAGTVQLGAGQAVRIPDPASPEAASLRVVDADGSELVLDFSAWDGTGFSGTVRGEGSVSVNGTDFTSVDFTETDLRLIDNATGTVLHVDTTALGRAGNELVAFRGATNLFDTLSGIANDLRNADGLQQLEVLDRVNERLREVEDLTDNLLVGLGELAARTDRLNSAQDRLGELDVSLRSLLSETEDVDLTAAVLEMSQAENTLQVAQATGARLIQQSLLNYLR